MVQEPSSAPEGVDPEVEPEGDPEGGPDIDELFDRPDAASMEVYTEIYLVQLSIYWDVHKHTNTNCMV